MKRFHKITGKSNITIALVSLLMALSSATMHGQTEGLYNIKNPEIRKRVEEDLEKYRTNTPAEFNQRLTEVGRNLPALEFVGNTPGLGESKYGENGESSEGSRTGEGDDVAISAFVIILVIVLAAIIILFVTQKKDVESVPEEEL